MTFRIDQLYAYIMLDDDGDEGVPVYSPSPGYFLPLTGADATRLAQLRPVAQTAATERKRNVTLVRFERAEVVEVVGPEPPKSPTEALKEALGVDPTDPAYDPSKKPGKGPPKKGLSADYANFEAPLAAPTVRADGMIVAGAIEDGEPAIAISFLVKGKLLPPISVRGAQAADLVGLVRQAYNAAKQTEN